MDLNDVHGESSDTSILEDQSDGSFEVLQSDTSIVEDQSDISIVEIQSDTSVGGDQFDTSFEEVPSDANRCQQVEVESDISILEEQSNTGIVENQSDASFEVVQSDTSIVEDKFDTNNVADQSDISILEDQSDISILEGQSDISIVEVLSNISILEVQSDTSIFESQSDISITENQSDTSIFGILSDTSSSTEPWNTSYSEIKYDAGGFELLSNVSSIADLLDSWSVEEPCGANCFEDKSDINTLDELSDIYSFEEQVGAHNQYGNMEENAWFLDIFSLPPIYDTRGGEPDLSNSISIPDINVENQFDDDSNVSTIDAESDAYSFEEQFAAKRRDLLALIEDNTKLTNILSFPSRYNYQEDELDFTNTCLITTQRLLSNWHSISTEICPICLQRLGNLEQLLNHFKCHSQTPHIDTRKSMRISFPPFKLKFDFTSKQNIEVTLKNRSMNPLIIDRIFLQHPRFQWFTIKIEPTILKEYESYEFSISRYLLIHSPNPYSLFVVLSQPATNLEYFAQHHIVANNPNILYIEETKHCCENCNMRNIPMCDLPFFKKSIELTYLIENNMRLNDNASRKVVECHRKVQYLRSSSTNGLNAENYVEMLELMTEISDAGRTVSMSSSGRNTVLLTPTVFKRVYTIATCQFAVRPTDLDIYDRVAVDDYDGVVLLVLPDLVQIQLWKEVDLDRYYTVVFKPNPLFARLELQALNIIKLNRMEAIFFPKNPPAERKPDIEIDYWFNGRMIFNPEQQVAVRNIVWKTAFPSPYILFGPPGTGKTTTLVEAIVQIVTRFPDRRILVAAQSNSACNEIAIRLLKYIDSTKMYRFYCRSTKIEKIPEELRQCTTICSGFYIMPTASILAAAQITIGTLTACGRLAQFMIRLEKYSYVFIDECGSATEPATLCGIAGHAFQWQNTALILAGDPYQLGPVVKNAYLVQMGYDISMLERIMGLPLYQKDPVTGKYNTALITKLVRNYRCHEAIIAFSNKHFYDNELSTVAPLEITSLATNCELLPNGDFPIVLHHVFGESQKTGSGTSFYNCDELLVVVEYLEKIFSGAINNRIIPQEEVGVISPYKLQVEYLQLICSNRGWNKVEVGSIEHYQGREKAVIILSTVRSLTSNVGFLNNKKRLNVAVTRAKALLVVVGNCQTLQKDPLWKDFVRYCVDNRATAGKPFYCSQDNDNIYKVDVIDALLNAFML